MCSSSTNVAPCGVLDLARARQHLGAVEAGRRLGRPGDEGDQHAVRVFEEDEALVAAPDLLAAVRARRGEREVGLVHEPGGDLQREVLHRADAEAGLGDADALVRRSDEQQEGVAAGVEQGLHGLGSSRFGSV